MRAQSSHEDKTCDSCGRRIQWRKKWERDWEQVRYCSAGCRKRGVTATDQALEESIRGLLASRPASSSICPSEAAKDVSSGTDPEAWRDLMEPARRAARRLVAAGEVQVTQGGVVVDPSTAKGPIRIRSARR